MSLTSSSRFGLRETSEYRGHSAQDALREGQKNEQGKNAKREYARAFEEVKAQRDEHHDKGSEHGAPWGEHAAQNRHEQHQEHHLDTEGLREDELIHERQQHAGEGGDTRAKREGNAAQVDDVHTAGRIRRTGFPEIDNRTIRGQEDTD